MPSSAAVHAGRSSRGQRTREAAAGQRELLRGPDETRRVCDANSGLINLRRRGGHRHAVGPDPRAADDRAVCERLAGPAEVRGQHQRGRRPRLGESALRGRRDHRASAGAGTHGAGGGSAGRRAAARGDRRLRVRTDARCACSGPARSPAAGAGRTTTSTGSNLTLRRRPCSTKGHVLDLDGTGSALHLRRAVPRRRRHDRSCAAGGGGVRRRRDLPSLHADGLEPAAREDGSMPRPRRLARSRRDRSRARPAVRDRGRDGDEGVPRVRAARNRGGASNRDWSPLEASKRIELGPYGRGVARRACTANVAQRLPRVPRTRRRKPCASSADRFRCDVRRREGARGSRWSSEWFTIEREWTMNNYAGARGAH